MMVLGTVISMEFLRGERAIDSSRNRSADHWINEDCGMNRRYL